METYRVAGLEVAAAATVRELAAVVDSVRRGIGNVADTIQLVSYAQIVVGSKTGSVGRSSDAFQARAVSAESQDDDDVVTAAVWVVQCMVLEARLVVRRAE